MQVEHNKLEMVMMQLQKELDDCHTEFEITRMLTTTVDLRAPDRRDLRQHQFLDTPNWEQYRAIFEAIVCSNGWDDVTAALQLVSDLDGDVFNVALLIPESRRVVQGFLFKSL